MAVKLRKGKTMTGEALHDETLATEKAGTQLLLEEYRQLHCGFCRQEAALLQDDLPARRDGEGRILPGKLEAKAIMPGPPLAV